MTGRRAHQAEADTCPYCMEEHLRGGEKVKRAVSAYEQAYYKTIRDWEDGVIDEVPAFVREKFTEETGRPWPSNVKVKAVNTNTALRVSIEPDGSNYSGWTLTLGFVTSPLAKTEATGEDLFKREDFNSYEKKRWEGVRDKLLKMGADARSAEEAADLDMRSYAFSVEADAEWERWYPGDEDQGWNYEQDWTSEVERMSRTISEGKWSEWRPPAEAEA